MLAEVRHALHNLEAGTYGVCDSCGRSIEAERLHVWPQATLCLACKARQEHTQVGHKRHPVAV